MSWYPSPQEQIKSYEESLKHLAEKEPYGGEVFKSQAEIDELIGYVKEGIEDLKKEIIGQESKPSK